MEIYQVIESKKIIEKGIKDILNSFIDKCYVIPTGIDFNTIKTDGKTRILSVTVKVEL